MLLKVNYGENEARPHPFVLAYVVLFDAENNVVGTVQEFDTETLAGKQPSGSIINVDHFGWYPSNQTTLETLLVHLPRGYHHLVHLTPA